MTQAIQSNWPYFNKVWGWYDTQTNFIFKITKLAVAILGTPFAIVLDVINRVFSICFTSSKQVAATEQVASTATPEAPQVIADPIAPSAKEDDAEPVPFYKNKTCYKVCAAALLIGIASSLIHFSL